jgi:hypothetical protein
LDYYLFPNLKRRKSSSSEEATLTVDRWFATQPKEFFLDGLKKIEQGSHKRGAWGGGGEVEKIHFFSVL